MFFTVYIYTINISLFNYIELLIILGEVLGYFNSYFLSDFSDFTTGLLLGLSVGMKLVGIILSLVGIIQVSNDNK